MLPNAIFFHRIGHWCYTNHIPLIPYLTQLYIFIIHGSRIPPKTKIGKGTKFTAKGMGVVLNGEEIIGSNCVIGHQVKMLRKNPYKECARVGNNVYISSSAVIVGNVIIDDDVIIGANSVVTKSVPKGSIVAGIPARIIGNTSDLDYSIMDNPKFKEGFAPYL